METHSYESRASEIVHEGITSQVEQMASFVTGARFEALGLDARQQLKVRILDALGCGLGALDCEPIRMIRGYVLVGCRTGRDLPTRIWQLVALAPQCWPGTESQALWR
jgi:hypothetical protein